MLEVLVAVAVLGVAMAAIIKASSEMTGNAVQLRDRTLASWVASNVLTELRIDRVWETEDRDGETRMAERDWYWEAEIQSTPNPALRRVDIRIFSDPDDTDAITVLTALLADPERQEMDIPPAPPDDEGL
nr:type II secretion system minor pseudopilin GspI [Methylonatrum kenyense]